MAAKDCIEAIIKASGRPMTMDEATDIFEALEARIRREVRGGMTRSEAARKAGQEMSEEARIAAAMEKRTAAINAVRWEELSTRHVEGREADALSALTSGFTGRYGRDAAFRNAGYSVSAMATAAQERAMGGLAADLLQADLLKAVKGRSRAFERDIIREMERLDLPDASPPTGNSHAVEVAKIFNKHLEMARLAQNEAGAWIGKLDGYIGRQTHDAYKVAASGFDKWRAFIEPRLHERVFAEFETPSDVTKFLHDTWRNLGSGIHDAPNADWAGYQGVGSLAKRVSQHRKLHFKNADAWLEYNEQFGKGSVFDAVIHSVTQGHVNAASMRMLGPNPQAMFKRLADEWAETAKQRGDLAQADRIRRDFASNTAILDLAMDRPIVIKNTTGAMVMQLLRNVMSFKLGGMLISSFNDLSTTMANARHSGQSAFTGLSTAIRGLIPGDTPEGRAFAHEVGFMVDGLRMSLRNRFNAMDGPAGKMAGAVNVFYRLTGQGYWTEHIKYARGFSLMLSAGHNSGKAFGDLDRLLQTTLRRYGIEAAEWDAIRQASQRVVDNKSVLAPADILQLSDEAVAPLAIGVRTADAVRRDLHDRYSTYIIDQTREALSEPDARTRHIMTGGSLPAGSFWGETARAISQFKSFTITNMFRNLFRELFREGVNVPGVAVMVVGGAILGHISNTVGDILAGKNPRPVEDAGDMSAQVFRALARGGGLGIYGDFLFGEFNKYGRTAMETVAGPLISTGAEAIALLSTLREGEGQRAAAESVRLMKQLPPLSFFNLFYTRMAMDYLIFHRLQEFVNPGYLRRFERKMERDTGQTYWLPPSAAVAP
jgi:hypothetical protein